MRGAEVCNEGAADAVFVVSGNRKRLARYHEVGDEAVAHILAGNGALEAAPIVGLRRVDEHQELAVVEGLGKGVVGVQAKIPTRPSYGLQRQGVVHVVHGVSAGVGVVEHSGGARSRATRSRPSTSKPPVYNR